MKLNHIFWGVFLITFGIIFLLETISIITFPLDFALKFWPSILILIGLRLLLKNKQVNLIVIILSAVLVAVIIYTFIFRGITCNYIRLYDDSKEERRESISQTFLSTIKKSKLEIDYGLGNFFLDSDTDKLIEGEVSYIGNEYYFDGVIYDSTAEYKLNSKYKNPIIFLPSGKSNKLNLSINKSPAWEINLKTNFVNNELKLETVNLQSFNIESNFSKNEILLSTTNQVTDSEIKINFSKMKLQIPSSVGVELFVEENFSKIRLINLSEVSENHYRSKNFDEKENKLKIKLAANFSSIEIDY